MTMSREIPLGTYIIEGQDMYGEERGNTTERIQNSLFMIVHIKKLLKLVFKEFAEYIGIHMIK